MRPPSCVRLRTPRLVCVAFWKRRSSSLLVMPSARAASSARRTWPEISSSPTTTDSRPLVTANRWAATSAPLWTVTETRRSSIGDAARRGHRLDDRLDRHRLAAGERLVDVEIGLEAVAGREHDGSGDEQLVIDEGARSGRCADRETLQDVQARVPMVRGETQKHEPNVNRVPLNPSHPLRRRSTRPSPLIRAYRGERPETTPVWFMRQAGRSLPEYRELRVGTDMLETCLTPELASEITLQPVRRHDVDAAIFFSDIVIPVQARRCRRAHRRRAAARCSSIRCGRRPTSRALPPLDPAALDPIREAVAATVAELGDTPLIGFAGAPYTLASYLVEGGPSKEQLRTRALMHSDPATWSALLAWCAEVTGAFLAAQIEAGASAGQLFDSWAGSLSLADYTGARRAALDARRSHRLGRSACRSCTSASARASCSPRCTTSVST